MKYLLLVALFIVASNVDLSAQACAKSGNGSKTCCMSKKSSNASADIKSDKFLSNAEQIASLNENISKRVCPESGTVSFFEKEVSTSTGNVSWNEVTFNEETKVFTRVASSVVEKSENMTPSEVKACIKNSGDKNCCVKKASSI